MNVINSILLEYWHVLAMVVSGIVGYTRLKYDVDDLKGEVKSIKEERKEDMRELRSDVKEILKRLSER